MDFPAVDQYTFINIELVWFLDMNGTSFDIDLFEGIVNLVIHSCYLDKPFFCSRGRDFEVVSELFCSRVEAVKAAVE